MHDNHAAALQPFEGTPARVTRSCVELARSSEVIAVCVRDDVELLAVAYGDASLSDSIEPGTTVIVHSTVRPQTVRDLGETLALRGGRVVDAAVTGGAHLADRGELCAMVGAKVERSAAFNSSGRQLSSRAPLDLQNILGEKAVFLLKRRSAA